MQQHAFTVYNASAGSGKTFTLVKEYLKIILTSNREDAYKNILAITFTNKAVGEMKSRIVESLSEFVKDNPSAKALDMMNAIQADTNISHQAIQRKSKQIIKHIIHNYASFDISTIDKFTHKVIRTFAHDLQLPTSFEVSLETDILLQESVDAIIAQAGENEAITKLLIDFTMEKTDDDKSWDVSREIMAIGKLILNENNREEITHFNTKEIPQFIEVKNKLQEICQKLEEECVGLAIEALGLIDDKGIDVKSFSGGHFPKHLIGIKDGKFNPKNKMYHEVDDIKVNKTAKDSEIIEMIKPDLLRILDSIYKKKEKQSFYHSFLKNITPLSLLNTLNNELKKIQKEKNVLSIAEFNSIIHNEIQNQPAPFIYERMGERYRHFFIDEFQDTSEMQWQNLIPLIDNALASEELNGEKGSLLLVGDPKQSIYRWRGGKAEQFIALSKSGSPFSNPDKDVQSLDTNYRSYSEVITFNNAFFNVISSEFESLDYKDLYENHSAQKINSKKGGYVSISFLPKAEKNEEDEEDKSQVDLYLDATLATIQKVIKQGFSYKDIVVLTRKRGPGIAVANYLTEHNIPILSSETLMLHNSLEVQMVIHLLRYLNNSSEKESKVYFLHYISTRIQSELPIHDFIARGMSFEKEEELERWLQEYDVAVSFKNLRRKTLYEAVEVVILKFIKPTQSHAYLQYFLDLVLEKDIKGQFGIFDFLRYWDDNNHKFSIPSPEGSDAVKIMTVHKSKGLEFPVVIFPFADEAYSNSPKDKLWIDNVDEEIDFPKLLIDNSSAVEGFGEEATRVYQQKKQEELLDNVNVLYVALTRAEEQLYVISKMNLKKDGTPSENNMSTFFIRFLDHNGVFDPNKFEYEFGEAKKISEVNEVKNPVKIIPFLAETLNTEAIKIAQKESLMWGTTQQEAIEYGNLVHEILSFVTTKDDVSLAITKALENGLITRNQSESVAETIQQIVNNEALTIFFDAKSKVLNEQIIIQKEGGILKPDRIVFVTDQEVCLLDYKTGVNHPKYTVQLEQYELALLNIGLQVIKKTLVFIGKEIKIVNL